MGIFGSSQKRWAKNAAAYLAQQRQQGQRKAQELFGQYLPAGEMGMDAMSRMRDILLGGDMSQFEASPGYQFRLQEGQQALERSAAAGGRLASGRQMREATRYGQGTASEEFQNTLARLSGFATQGTNIGMQAGQNILAQYGAPASAVGQGIAGIGTASPSQYGVMKDTAQLVAGMAGLAMGGAGGMGGAMTAMQGMGTMGAGGAGGAGMAGQPPNMSLSTGVY